MTVDASSHGLSSPTFVGLDLSLTSTGIAIIRDGRMVVSRVTSKPAADRDTGAMVSRLNAIARTILERIPPGAHVGVEGPSYASTGSAAHVLGGLWWLVRDSLFRAGFDVLIVPPSTVKKYATGSGNAKKDEVLAAIVRRYLDVEVRGNDEADALTIASIVARFEGYPVESAPLSEKHLAALSGVGR